MEKYVEPARPQMTIWGMRVACPVRKARNTYSEYVILIFYTATIFARTGLYFTFIPTLLVLYVYST